MSAPGAQALAEFALVLPLILFAFLGMTETAFLFATQHGYQSAADVEAAWTAAHGTDDPRWAAMVRSEGERAGCVRSPEVSYPDGGAASGDRVWVKLTCPYVPHVLANLWAGMPVTVTAEAVVPGAVVTPSLSLSPVPS